MLLFLIFIAVPIIEITLFIEVGGQIGLGATLAIILTTALIGSVAIRTQGRAMAMALSRASLAEAPDLMSQGLLLFVAGVFLITPGFLTDALGLSLLVPPIRRRVRDQLVKMITVRGGTFGGFPGAGGPRPGGQDASDPRRPAAGFGEKRPAPASPAPRKDGEIDDAVILEDEAGKRPPQG